MTNGKKYKTAKERAEAFRKYHDEHHHKCSDMPYTDDAINRCVMCIFKWLNCEAKEEKPLPCPFCGSACNVLTDDLQTDETVYYVSCTKCNYQSSDKDIKATAIAAHNRVARAAKEKEAK